MNLRLLCSLLLFNLNIHAQEIISGREKEIVFYDVNVITMDANRVLEHQTVVTKNGRITSLGPVKTTKFPKESTVVDGKGKYLIPGLAEMHAHVPPIDDIEPMKEVVRFFAVNGITT